MIITTYEQAVQALEDIKRGEFPETDDMELAINDILEIMKEDHENAEELEEANDRNETGREELREALQSIANTCEVYGVTAD